MGLRHWKQRFEADADLIFSKRMKLGCCGVDVVNPGDPITTEMKKVLGRNRLRRWWEAKRIELARFDGDLGRQITQDEQDERELAQLQSAEDAAALVDALDDDDTITLDDAIDDGSIHILEDQPIQPDLDADTTDAEQPPELPF